ncbi:hypothetical protein [Actinoplanes sp. NPDC049265]|uniref:hypothetical protein n=1 Tax=Actinoplanes sp. NPDC049265 TaxID=3363902 RepID=UPI003716B67C
MLAEILVADQTPAGSLLDNKLLLAVVTAILGLGAGYLLKQVRDRNDERRQLSWDSEINTRLIEIGTTSKEKVKILYGPSETPVDELASIRLRVTNTGNRAIKNQFLRLRFPDKAKVLEFRPEPKPEPELNVDDVSDFEALAIERRYQIGHLEVGQSVSFLLVADGGDWTRWSSIYPFNEEGDVEFVRRDAARTKEDQEHVSSFCFWFFAFVMLASLMAALPIPPYYLLPLVPILLVPAAFVLAHLRPVSRLFESLAATFLNSRESGESRQAIHSHGERSLAFGRVTGGVHVYPATSSESQSTS